MAETRPPACRRSRCLVVAFTLGAAAILCGCVAGGSSQSIRAAYAVGLGQLQTGMDLASFQRAIPEARLYDTFSMGTDRFDTYRLDHRFKPDQFPAETQTLYFFFTNQRLDHWGAAAW